MDSQRKALAWVSIAMVGAITVLGIFGFMLLVAASIMLGVDGVGMFIASLILFIGIMRGILYSCNECLYSWEHTDLHEA